MEKLIRHSVPHILHPDYPSMQTREVSSIEEHVRFLVQKLFEEIEELYQAVNNNEKIYEFIDLLEVTDALLYFSMHPEGRKYIQFHEALNFYKSILNYIRIGGFDEGIIFRKKQEKLSERGGFRVGVIWIS